MERLKRFWNAFKDIAIVFSFLINFIFLVLALILAVPAARAVFAVTSGMVEPLLGDLDAAFVGLGEATIDTTISIDQQIPIRFDQPLNQDLPINFMLPIEQPTVVVLTEPVPLTAIPARFNLPGGGGVINGYVSLTLPEGLPLPIQLSMSVPVIQTVPVAMTVPIDQQVPIRMNVPVKIKLGESGLAPAVEDLRAVFRPIRAQVEALPDGIELR